MRSTCPASARPRSPRPAPTRRAGSARWGTDGPHVVGNAMGGRVALEIALREPERVGALALLCPAVAFVKRGYHPIVRLARPELGFLPHSFGRARLSSTLTGL